jgi:hypothetical protein
VKDHISYSPGYETTTNNRMASDVLVSRRCLTSQYLDPERRSEQDDFGEFADAMKLYAGGAADRDGHGSWWAACRPDAVLDAEVAPRREPRLWSFGTAAQLFAYTWPPEHRAGDSQESVCADQRRYARARPSRACVRSDRPKSAENAFYNVTVGGMQGRSYRNGTTGARMSVRRRGGREDQPGEVCPRCSRPARCA